MSTPRSKASTLRRSGHAPTSMKTAETLATKAPKPRGSKERVALEAALERSRVESRVLVQRLDLDYLLRGWARFVTEVEDGFEVSIHDYTQDAAFLQGLGAIVAQVPRWLGVAIHSAFRRWARRGYKLTYDDYVAAISKRIEVDFISEQVPKRLANTIRAAFAPWDERFRKATERVKGAWTEQVWYQRIPKRLDPQLRATLIKIHQWPPYPKSRIDS
jgi:hypothetical protein